jgi:hypothetical protein
MFSHVGRALAAGRSPVHGVLPTLYVLCFQVNTEWEQAREPNSLGWKKSYKGTDNDKELATEESMYGHV